MTQAEKPGLLSDEAREKARQELEQAFASPEVAGKAKALEQAIDAKEEADAKALLGLDLDFDPKEFITQGVVTKRGIKVLDKMVVDMKTLTTKERMLAESLVRDKFGSMKLDQVYFTAVEAAVLAMAVIRINNQPFQVPNLNSPNTEEFKALYAKKRQLFETFLEAANDFQSVLSVLYHNLESVQVPDEVTQKKS